MWLTATTSVLLVLFYDLTTAAGYELTLEPQDEKFVRAVGQGLLLTCTVDMAARPNERLALVWKDPKGQAISERTEQRIHVERESFEANEPLSSKLIITDISASDNGHYTCELLVNNAKQVHRTISLTAFKDITFDNAPSPQNPELHSDALIACRVSAEPKPEVSWKFKNRRIQSHDRYKIEPDGLRIRNINQSDNGEYICEAAVPSKGSYATRRIAVQVHIRPVITKQLKDEETVQGRNLVMSCRANGLPLPKYEFRKEEGDKRQVLGETQDGRIVIDADGGRIEFKPLQKEDQGKYYCVAINSVGHNESSAYVRVLVPPEITELRNITKNENDTAILVCKSRGDPGPVMTFRKFGSSVDLNTTSHDGRWHIKQGTGTVQLEIKPVLPEDAGNFTCTSTNQVGSHSKVGSITVNYRPRFHPHGDPVRKMYIWAGKTHNVSCNVHAHPTPSITWLRYGRVLENNDSYHIFTSGHHSNLQVRVKEADQSWIYGPYVCRVRNSLGEVQSTINLTRATVPDVPHLRVKERYPNTIILEAEPPSDNGGKEVIGYRVEYGRKMIDFAVGKFGMDHARGAPGHRTTTTTAKPASNDNPGNKVTELVIENLKPKQPYTFYVRSKNEIGVGNTTEIKVETEDYSKPHAINIISNDHGREAYAYRIVWSPPKTGGRPIQRYYIKYRKTAKNSPKVEEWTQVVVEDDPTSPKVEYKLTNLNSKTVYECKIEAENEKGRSPSTSFLFYTAQHTGPQTARILEFVKTFVLINRWYIGAGAALFVLLIIVIDISCYFLCGRGLTMCICVKLCGSRKDNDDDESEDGPNKDGGRDGDVEAQAGGGGGGQNGGNLGSATTSTSTGGGVVSKSILKKSKDIENKEMKPEHEPLIKDSDKCTANDRSPEKKVSKHEEYAEDEKQKLVDSSLAEEDADEADHDEPEVEVDIPEHHDVIGVADDEKCNEYVQQQQEEEDEDDEPRQDIAELEPVEIPLTTTTTTTIEKDLMMAPAEEEHDDASRNVEEHIPEKVEEVVPTAAEIQHQPPCESQQQDDMQEEEERIKTAIEEDQSHSDDVVAGSCEQSVGLLVDLDDNVPVESVPIAAAAAAVDDAVAAEIERVAIDNEIQDLPLPDAPDSHDDVLADDDHDDAANCEVTHDLIECNPIEEQPAAATEAAAIETHEDLPQQQQPLVSLSPLASHKKPSDSPAIEIDKYKLDLSGTAVLQHRDGSGNTDPDQNSSDDKGVHTTDVSINETDSFDDRKQSPSSDGSLGKNDVDDTDVDLKSHQQQQPQSDDSAVESTRSTPGDPSEFIN